MQLQNKKARRKIFAPFKFILKIKHRLRVRFSGQFVHDRRGDFRGFDAFDAMPAFRAVQFKFHFVADLAVQQRLADGREIADDALVGIGIPRAENRERLGLVGFQVRWPAQPCRC